MFPLDGSEDLGAGGGGRRVAGKGGWPGCTRTPQALAAATPDGAGAPREGCSGQTYACQHSPRSVWAPVPFPSYPLSLVEVFDLWTAM